LIHLHDKRARRDDTDQLTNAIRRVRIEPCFTHAR
jgi:hypothetical protein